MRPYFGRMRLSVLLCVLPGFLKYCIHLFFGFRKKLHDPFSVINQILTTEDFDET